MSASLYDAMQVGAWRRACAATGLELTLVSGCPDHHNWHFRGRVRGGEVFVKLLDDRDCWARSVAAAALAELACPGTPRLLEYGEHEGRFWLVYEWRDLSPFAADSDALRQAGSLVGRLHSPAAEDASSVLAPVDLDGGIDRRARVLELIGQAETGRRILDLHDRIGPVRWPDERRVLLHGDLHWANVAIDERGEVVLLDLETAAIGHPLLDFGKLLDLGQLADPASADAFFDGYDQEAGPVRPWPAEAMRSVALWAAAGVLAYATSRSMPGFAEHGHRRLAELEDDTAGGLRR